MFLAIDGGGTKTQYLLINDSFEVVDQFIGGTTNYERLEGKYEELRTVLSEVINVLFSRNRISVFDIQAVAAGMSGADSNNQIHRIAEVFESTGLKHVDVFNDGFLPILANCESMSGICLNCGTGVCCAAIDAHGVMRKTGGLDEWCEDAGGGYWLIRKIFCKIYDEIVLGKIPTLMSKLCVPGISGDELCEFLNILKVDSKISQKWIRAFFSAYDQGDQAALKIAEEIFSRCEDYFHAVSEDMDFGEKISVILEGSILRKAASETFLYMLKKRISKVMNRDICWVEPSEPPAFGALKLIESKYRISDK